MSSPPVLPAAVQTLLDQTLGACFIGFLFTAIFYGVTCLQLYIYFTKNARDELTLKLLVTSLWVLGTLQLVLITIALYHYLISNFGNLLAALLTFWSLPVMVAISVTIECIVRGIFISRVLMLSRCTWLTVVLAVLNVMVYAVGLVFTREAFRFKSFTDFFNDGAWIVYLAFSTNCVLDVLITVVLMYYLFKIRYGFSSTTRFINKLIISILNSGLVTSLLSILVLALFVGNRDSFGFMTVYFPLSQVFYNALLASLNLRESLRGNSRVDTEGKADEEMRAAEPWTSERPRRRPLRIPTLAGILSNTGVSTILPPYTSMVATETEPCAVFTLVPNRGPPFENYPPAVPGKE